MTLPQDPKALADALEKISTYPLEEQKQIGEAAAVVLRQFMARMEAMTGRQFMPPQPYTPDPNVTGN